MKKQLLALLMATALLKAPAQNKYQYIISDSVVGLGLAINNGLKKTAVDHNINNAVVSHSTVATQGKNKLAEPYIRIYLNDDVYVNVIAARINPRNKHLYKVYSNISFIYADDTLQMNNVSFGTEEAFNEPTLTDSGYLSYYTVYKQEIDSRTLLKYTVTEAATGKIVSVLNLEFLFPKPELEMAALDIATIQRQTDRPSDDIHYDLSGENKWFKQQVEKANLVESAFGSNAVLPKRLVLPAGINSILLRFKTLKRVGEEISHLEFRFSTDTHWKTTVKSENPTVILHNLPVGKYKLLVRYPEQADAVWEYEFEIRPDWTQTTTFKVFMGSFITALFCLLVFGFNQRKNRRRLKNETLKKNALAAQLAGLRSQLHPHFIFNALNSIQGLVNKKDLDAANSYISTFGSLLRAVIDQGDKTMHPLASELAQLKNYLQLERLRFRFNYAITVSEKLNPAEIDIPLMLLQPFVENALKHGIAEKREEGTLSILVDREGSDMFIQITDNGKGYKKDGQTQGRGNLLVNDKIAILNSLLERQFIRLDVLSGEASGTTVTLWFVNWL